MTPAKLGTQALHRRRFLARSASAVGLVAVAGGLGACSSGNDTAGDESMSGPADASAPTATPTTPTDGPSEADIGFLTDMSAHHAQALVMCQRVLGSEVGSSVIAAASEVLQNQAIELGMMRAWLADWGASTAPPETVMAWMHDGMDMPLAMMPGLATDAELAELSQLDGVAKGKRWLELMMAHHVGGVAMAEAAVTLCSAEKVVGIAETMATVQTFEISQYEQLLATEYALG